MKMTMNNKLMKVMFAVIVATLGLVAPTNAHFLRGEFDMTMKQDSVRHLLSCGPNAQGCNGETQYCYNSYCYPKKADGQSCNVNGWNGDCLSSICEGGKCQPSLSYCASGIVRDTFCCASSYGTCGGYGCADRPGGASACCIGEIEDHGPVCTNAGDVACNIPTRTSGFCATC